MGQVEEDFWTENKTSDGSYETPTENEEATITCRSPLTVAERATTPAGKWERASWRRRLS